jgi:hypothetical protein
MPDETVTEPSIGDLRAMLGGTEPEAQPAAETETPAPAASETNADGEPEPASEPDSNSGAERGPDGKFKAAAEPEDSPGVKKRIGKLLAEKRAAEDRAAALEAQLKAQPGSQPAKETAQPAAAPQSPPVSNKPKPQEKDFETYAAYNEALVDWKFDQQRAADATKAAADRAAEQEAALGRAWNERVDKVTAIHPDYLQVMAGEAQELDISPAMNRAIFTMERGPEVAYFLAKHPEDCIRIAKLDPLQAAAELGAIRAGLTKPAAPAAAGTPAAKLPKPAASVGGGAAPYVVDLNDPKLDTKTFKREFFKRLKAA